MTRILVLNGPNLNRLGSRQPEIYGSMTLATITAELMTATPAGYNIEVRQTNDEATLIDWIHEAVDTSSHVVLNPAAFTHYSYALADAAVLVREAGLELVEVHLSNPNARESFRSHSVISPVATGVIAGFGDYSFQLALIAIAHRESGTE